VLVENYSFELSSCYKRYSCMTLREQIRSRLIAVLIQVYSDINHHLKQVMCLPYLHSR